MSCDDTIVVCSFPLYDKNIYITLRVYAAEDLNPDYINHKEKIRSIFTKKTKYTFDMIKAFNFARQFESAMASEHGIKFYEFNEPLYFYLDED